MQLPLKVNKEYFLRHQAWPHNDLLTKVQLLHHTYLWPPLMRHNKADRERNEGMAKKFSEKFAKNML